MSGSVINGDWMLRGYQNASAGYQRTPNGNQALFSKLSNRSLGAFAGSEKYHTNIFELAKNTKFKKPNSGNDSAGILA